MTPSLLTAASWPIVGQLCWLLGKVMNFIYQTLDSMLPSDAGLVGLSIIIYTILVYTLMLPLTVTQQRSSRMTAAMNPEIKAIQKKYKEKSRGRSLDQAATLAQQEEIQQVYDKYGVSMMGGCLPLLIQMPLLFALYPVIYNIQEYVPAMKNAPAIVNTFLTIPDMTVSPTTLIKNAGSYDLPSVVIIITAILLPVLSGATQFASIKLSQAMSGQNEMMKDNPMASSMNSMMITMPLFSVFMVFTLPTGIGVYWIVSALVRIVQQVVINKHLSKMSLDELVEKNKEKAEKKKQQRGEKADRINAMAQQNTKTLSKSASKVNVKDTKEKEAKIEAAKNKAQNAKAGSLASKANMVKKYNENN